MHAMKSLVFLVVGLLTLIFSSSSSSSSSSTASAHNSRNKVVLDIGLAGCKYGDKRVGLSSVKSYLEQFGYLSSSSKTKMFDDVFDDNLESGIVAYQKFFHLKPTGVLDQSTLASMRKPRCGMTDVDRTNTTGVHGRNLYTYFNGRPTWPVNRRSLKYAFTTTGTWISPLVLSRVYARAFSRWEAVTNLNFKEVTMFEAPDIVLQFFVGDHFDGYPFDGPFQVLAHAFAPTDGRLHFDALEFWTASQDDAASPDLTRIPTAIDLESVTVHEIGHILGLGHSNVANAIMYPSISTRTRKVILAEDDVLGIQSLYGVK